MAFFKMFMGQAQGDESTSAFPDDDVYPVHILDDTKTMRSILIAWTLCFNDVLDADKLQSSLATLLDTGDWRKLGGRLRLNVRIFRHSCRQFTNSFIKSSGKLEIHVPRAFSAQRPAFSFSHENMNMAIEDHTMAKDLPMPNDKVTQYSGPESFAAFSARSDAPSTLQDLLAGDTPQISVHITSFTNATLVGLSWPHTIMDVMGQQAFLEAWSLVLAGRDSSVPPVLGAREDALCALTSDPKSPQDSYMLNSQRLAGLSMIKFGARFAWDMLTQPASVTRTVCLPKSTLSALRLQAQKDIPAAEFISDGDILAAWTIHAVSSSLPSPRPITALHAMNARFRLPSLLNANGVYLQNMLVPGFTFVSPAIARGPMGPIALDNRQRLLAQATEPQVLAALRELRVLGDTGTLLFGEPDAVLVPFTDWTKAKFFEKADFSAAVTKEGGVEGRANGKGKPWFQHCSSRKATHAARFMVIILGRDEGGNTWLTLTLPEAAWRKIEESLEGL